MATNARQYPGEIECGCCFDSTPTDRIIRCPAAHPLCVTCLAAHTTTQLDKSATKISCIDVTTGCSVPFDPRALANFLPPDIVRRYEALAQQEALRAANIDDLAECPFCNYACIMEASVDADPLFRCQNHDGGCGVVSCRRCRERNHGKAPCQDRRTNVEEAMTAALIRLCPACKTSYIKTQGCNKMTCTKETCKATFCYICRQIVFAYDHFSRDGAGPSRDGAKCRLYDARPLDEQHAQEVEAARVRAETAQAPIPGPSNPPAAPATRIQPNRGSTLIPRPYIPPENLPPVHLVPIEQLERDLQEARRQQYNARNRYDSTRRKPWLAHWVDTRRFEMWGYNDALVAAQRRLDERLEYDARVEAEREQARARARRVEEGREREAQVEVQRAEAERRVREREQAQAEAQRAEAERRAREREQARARAQWEERQEHNAQMEAQRSEAERRAREREEAWAQAEFEAMFFQPVAQPQRRPYAHNHRWIQRVLGDRNMSKALSFVFQLVLGLCLGVLLHMLLPAPLGSGSLQRYILRVLR